MFYIKLDESMSLAITVNEPIYRGDNLNQKITYLIPLTIGDVDMLTATVYLNYIRVDGEPDVVMLERQENKYNEGYYQYTLPITCKLTKYAGEVCTWIQIYSGTVSNPVISKTGECILEVLDSKDIDSYLDDHNLTALYQLKQEMNDGFTQVSKSIEWGGIKDENTATDYVWGSIQSN